jgi:Ca2+-binding RTX toxin-like protein
VNRIPRLALAAAGLLTGLVALAGPASAGSSLLAAAERSPDRPGGLVVAPTHSIPGDCRGEAADHIVYPGEEYVATEGDDVIVVIGPDAVVWGQYGDDLICVYAAADAHYGGSTIYGSFGDDTIITYSGNNTVLAYGGDADADRVYLNGDHETVETGDGNDVVYANGALVADIDTGDGNDTVFGSPGGDEIDAGSGNDSVRGAAGDDTIEAGDGNDRLYGGAGWDVLDGMAHYDECHDQAGSQGATFTNCEVEVVTNNTGPGAVAFG